jgi:hypothetical protein
MWHAILDLVDSEVPGIASDWMDDHLHKNSATASAVLTASENGFDIKMT